MESFVRDLMAHSEWADAVFFHAWAKSPARDHEEMRTRVAHIVGVQGAFKSMFKGETPAPPPGGAPPSHEELQRLAQSGHVDLRAFTEGADTDALRQTLRIPWFPDPPCVIAVGEALVQVAMHTQHHRGQCMTRLKDLGGQPKNVDWIIWLWQHKPAARWT